ncbi:MAG: hypothetical protein ABFD46_09690 [Armatimonadota bacterium]
MRSFVCFGLLLAVVLSVPGYCAVFQDDFSGGLNSRYWYVTMTTPDMYSVDTTHKDIRLAKVAPTPGGYKDVEINLNLSALTSSGMITGDFDIQVDFRDANISGGGLNQVELHTSYADGTAFFNVKEYSNVHVWTGSYRSELPTTATEGRFRIKRVGSTVTGYLNDQQIWSSDTYPAALNWVAFSIQNNNGSDDPISVTYDNFSISADEIFPSTTTPKLLTDGSPLTFSGYIATSGAGDFPDFFYAEASNRYDGIRIAATPDVVSNLTRGSVLSVTGNMATTAAGEREIIACRVDASPSTSLIKPLAMTNRSVGGADMGISGLGQCGVYRGSGLNNVGLLIRIWGKITDVGENYLVIDDGSGSPVRVDTSFVSSQPGKGSFAAMTGLSSLYKPDTLRQRLLLPLAASDWYVTW